MHVDDGCLQRWQDTSTQNCHDETGCTKLSIIAKTPQGYTIDGREHQRHASADCYQAVETPDIMKGNDANREATASYRQYHQQLTGIEEAEDEGADEARAAEQYHRYDVELL